MKILQNTPQRIIEKELNLAEVFDSIFCSIIVLDQKGYIKTLNQAAESLFNCTKELLVGTLLRDFIETLDQQEFNHYLEFCLQAKNGEFIEKEGVKLVNANKEHLFVNLKFSESIINGERYLMCIIKDLSKRKELEREIAKQKRIKKNIDHLLKREKNLGELKTRFVSMASHEFKTPLTGILSSVQVIRRYLQSEGDKWRGIESRKKIEKHFDKIQESVINLNHILNDFLSMGKLEEGKVTCKNKLFNLHEFLSDCCEELNLICKKGQKINHVHTGSATDVYTDSQILRNIITNLLSNAIKYSHKNQTILLFSKINKKKIEIMVKDEGVGIPANEQKNLFSRFFRAANVVNYQGTGLGLSIVKRYVNILNGTITFESIENKGTTFFVTIPVIKPKENINDPE